MRLKGSLTGSPSSVPCSPAMPVCSPARLPLPPGFPDRECYPRSGRCTGVPRLVRWSPDLHLRYPRGKDIECLVNGRGDAHLVIPLIQLPEVCGDLTAQETLYPEGYLMVGVLLFAALD